MMRTYPYVSSHPPRTISGEALGGRRILRYDGAAIKGLTGFDVGTGSLRVRPELLRLAKRGTTRTANEQFALAA